MHALILVVKFAMMVLYKPADQQGHTGPESELASQQNVLQVFECGAMDPVLLGIHCKTPRN